MMDKKIIYIAGGVVLVAVVVFFIGKIFLAGNAGQGNITDTSGDITTLAPKPLSKVASIPPGDVITIGTKNGAVSAKNFYKTALGAVEQFIVMAKNDDYEINYDTYTSGFSIYISAAPFDVNRAAAEKALLDVLGIDEAGACKLKIFESVSPDVDKNLAGLPASQARALQADRNLGLSFCAGGVQ